jgi:type I restriction enzyme M protein
MPRGNKPKTEKPHGSRLGFEATPWATADKLRGNLGRRRIQARVLDLVFLSDAFEEKHAALQKEKGADPEGRDEYLAENVFWVPPEARWSYIKGRAKDPLIGKLLNNAMIAIERDNASLKKHVVCSFLTPNLLNPRSPHAAMLWPEVPLSSCRSSKKPLNYLTARQTSRNCLKPK